MLQSLKALWVNHGFHQGRPRAPLALVTLALVAGLVGAPQSASASRGQQVVDQQQSTATQVKYHRAVKTLVVKKKIAKAVRPVAYYRKTSTFRQKGRLWDSKGHSGVDMAAPRGTTVRAAMSGVVTFAGWDGAYGKKIMISHGKGVVTVYGHLNRIKVKKGQRVTTGVRIGTVGSTGHTTGPHLHFEVRKFGRLVNPTTYMRSQGIRI